MQRQLDNEGIRRKDSSTTAFVPLAGVCHHALVPEDVWITVCVLLKGEVLDIVA